MYAHKACIATEWFIFWRRKSYRRTFLIKITFSSACVRIYFLRIFIPDFNVLILQIKKKKLFASGKLHHNTKHSTPDVNDMFLTDLESWI